MTCTVVRVDTGQPFIASATLITNGDGSVSFQLPDGTFAGQTPSDGQPFSAFYGVRYQDTAEAGAYQRATLSGNVVTFLTRPQDVPCVYLLGQGQAF